MLDQQISTTYIRSLVNQKVESVISSRLKQAEEIHPAYVKFWQQILNASLAGGKRLRAYLTVVGYGKIDDDILSVATAQELLHIAMYIHDDVIDADFIRHGQKNINGSYFDDYKNIVSTDEARHYANSMAILAGDALLSEAYQLTNNTHFSAAIKAQLNHQLGVSIFEVIGGELLDVEASFIKNMEVNPITVYRYKTASYSTAGPLIAGAYCAGQSAKTIDQLNSIAIDIGVAYQIQDDILGVFGSESKTGKSTIGDLREGKKTLLIEKHQNQMNQAQQRRFDSTFGNEQADAAAFVALKQDIIDSKAKQRTEEYIDFYFDKANKEIAKLADSRLANQLVDLIEKLASRSN